MDKQERDRFRELEKASGYSGRPVVRCVASKSGGFELLGSYYGAAGAQHARNEAEYINACVYGNHALLDHIDALEGQVQAAFYEGYGFGNFAGLHDHNTSPDLKWHGSKAKAALTQAEENGR